MMKFGRKEKIWTAIFLAVVALSGVSLLLMNLHKSDAKIAEIYVHGKLERTIDLSKVTEPYTFRIDTGKDAYNVIEVKPGKIQIIEANCKDQICVNQGAIDNDLKPIICLPHELVIKVTGEEDITAHDHEHEHEENHEAVDAITR